MEKEVKESNYNIFKMDALKRFLTYDHELVIKRLRLHAEKEYIYIPFGRELFRIGRKKAELMKRDCTIDEITEEPAKSEMSQWKDTDSNEALSICDLLCHTEKPLVLSENFMSLESLNRVKAGTSQTTLAGGMFKKMEAKFDGKDEQLILACETLGGYPAGKGDVAYEIPLFGSLHVRFSFYDSDEEFEPKITMMFPANVCEYLYYETLYYVVIIVLNRIEKMVK